MERDDAADSSGGRSRDCLQQTAVDRVGRARGHRRRLALLLHLPAREGVEQTVTIRSGDCSNIPVKGG